jgi:hypothetical protein
MGDGWQSNTKESIAECLGGKINTLRAYSRWSQIWAPLHVWVNLDNETSQSASVVATQHGLVAEWVALRSIACEVKVLCICSKLLSDWSSSLHRISGTKLPKP